MPTATIPAVTVVEADAYFATSPRGPAWAAVAPGQDLALLEAERWLMMLCPNPEAEGCCGDFTTAWTMAVCELALAIHLSPTAIISGRPTGMLAVQSQSLEGLSQSFFAPDQAQTSRYGIKASPVLRAFPWVGDMIGCWITRGKGSSAVIPRYRS